MLERLYPQFTQSLQPYLTYYDYLNFLHTSKKEFWKIRCETIGFRLKNDDKEEIGALNHLNLFINDEEFRKKLLERVHNPSKQLCASCRSDQLASLFSFRIPLRHVAVQCDLIETSSEVLLTMEGLVSEIYLANSRYWREDNFLQHLFPSLNSLIVLEAPPSLVVFPFVPSLKKLHLNGAENLIDITALSHLTKVTLSYCIRLEDVSPLRNCESVFLDSNPMVRDVSSLGSVARLELENLMLQDTTMLQHNTIVRILVCPGFTNFASFLNAREITLASCDDATSFDMTLFLQARLIDLTKFRLICDEEVAERMKQMKNLRMLKFSSLAVQPILPLLHLIPALKSIDIQQSRDAVDASLLKFIPKVEFGSACTLVNNFQGLGSGNKEVNISFLPTKDFSSLNGINRVKLFYCGSFTKVIQVKDVLHLSLILCHSVKSLAALKTGNIISLELEHCSRITSLNGAEDVKSIYIRHCEALENISDLTNGKNEKFAISQSLNVKNLESLDGKYLKEFNCQLGFFLYDCVYLTKTFLT